MCSIKQAPKRMKHNKAIGVKAKNWKISWSPLLTCVKKKLFLVFVTKPEGVIHFACLAVEGEVLDLKDKSIFWEVIIKKDGKEYRVQLDKHNG